MLSVPLGLVKVLVMHMELLRGETHKLQSLQWKSKLDDGREREGKRKNGREKGKNGRGVRKNALNEKRKLREREGYKNGLKVKRKGDSC